MGVISAEKVKKANFTFQEYGDIFGLKNLETEISEAIDGAAEIIEENRLQVDDHWDPPQPSSDANIWRYIDFTQLISILERGKLWFTNINEFEDPYEGTIPQQNLSDEITQIEEELGVSEEDASTLHNLVTTGPYFFGSKVTHSDSYVNCWNISEYQSAALWEQYLGSPQGLAIKTTVKNLEDSLTSDGEYILGSVRYINYEEESIPGGHLPVLYHKRRSFEHEQEFRVAYIASEDENLGTGIYVPVELDKLIDEIVIAPTAPGWFESLVNKVLDKYEVDCKVKESGLYSDPK